MAEPRSLEAPAKSDDDATGPVDTHDAVAAPVDPAPADDDNVAEVLPRPHRRVVWTALAVGTVMALLIAVLATRPPALDNQARSPLLGHPAPEFAGVSVTGAGPSAGSGRWSGGRR